MNFVAQATCLAKKLKPDQQSQKKKTAQTGASVPQSIAK